MFAHFLILSRAGVNAASDTQQRMIANRRSAEIMMVEKRAPAKTQMSGTISALAHFGTLADARRISFTLARMMLPMVERTVPSNRAP
jgi:hypothetical protein